jgi:hypothetical protein
MKSFLNYTVRLTAIVALPTIFLALSLPIRPANANEFNDCINELSDSGVSQEQAGIACSDALIPKELSACVSKIQDNTPIQADDALKACYRVRRPVDLGNCVVDIYARTLESPPQPQTNKPETTPKPEETNQTKAMDSVSQGETGEANSAPSPESPTMTDAETYPLIALDSCRRSLLPGRYSKCVIAVSEEVSGISPANAMETCLSAEDFPRDLFPAFTGN